MNGSLVPTYGLCQENNFRIKGTLKYSLTERNSKDFGARTILDASVLRLVRYAKELGACFERDSILLQNHMPLRK